MNEIEPVEQVAPEAPAETSEQRAERVRDEQGRFAKTSTPEQTAPEQAPTQKVESPQPTPDAPVVEARKPPSSWKKEYWEAYQKLDPNLAEYINQREQQFASGVSTYREEAIRAKELNDALAPFIPDLQQNGIKPAQWISNLGNAHQTLLKGTPEQKAGMFIQLLNDYKPPLDLMFQRGQDGSLYLNNQLAQQARAQQPQPDIRTTVAELLAEERMQAELEAMQTDTQKYPHFEAVRGTMAGLLQAGLTPDLESAYHKALLHHDDLMQADQQRQAEEAERHRRETEAARVAKARANAVSPRGATPIGEIGQGKKGLRETLTEQVNSVMGGGRV
jgi:hypothetical protein